MADHIVRPFFPLKIPAPGGRIVVVGDIHGHLDVLNRVLGLAKFDDERDILLCVGDLIDRGPQSLYTLRAFVGPARRRGFYSLLGNHEAILLARFKPNGLLRENAARIHRCNGGEWADAELEELRTLSEEMSALPLCATYVATDGRKIGVVHAELLQGHQWRELEVASVHADQCLDSGGDAVVSCALWGRRRIQHLERLYRAKQVGSMSDDMLQIAVRNDFTFPDVDLVIAGHTIIHHRLPVRCGNHLWIDTGACFPDDGGRLTVVDPVAGVYWQASIDDSWGPTPLPADRLLG